MAQMCKYGESKTTLIMMATVPHVTSGLRLRKFQADGFLLTRVYIFNQQQYFVLYCTIGFSSRSCDNYSKFNVLVLLRFTFLQQLIA